MSEKQVQGTHRAGHNNGCQADYRADRHVQLTHQNHQRLRHHGQGKRYDLQGEVVHSAQRQDVGVEDDVYAQDDPRRNESQGNSGHKLSKRAGCSIHVTLAYGRMKRQGCCVPICPLREAR